MRTDRWLQNYLKHKPKCQIYREKLKKNLGKERKRVIILSVTRAFMRHKRAKYY